MQDYDLENICTLNTFDITISDTNCSICSEVLAFIGSDKYKLSYDLCN